jgi:preprotein translocase subunit SecY
MRICPNEDCPHARRVGRPAEYVDGGAASCADCGAELVEAEEAAVDAVPAPEGRTPTGRLLITLLAAAVPFGLTWIPLPGLDLDVLGTLAGGMSDTRATFSLAALGLTSVIGMFQLVELVALAVPRLRPMRISGPLPRTRLNVIALALAALSCTLQAYFICIWLEGAGYSYGQEVVHDYGWGFRVPAMASLVTGVFVMLGAALIVSRRGLGAGFAALLGGSMLTSWLQDVWLMIQRLQMGELPFISLLLWIGAYGVLAAATAWVLRAPTRWRQADEDPVVRLPTSGLVPIIWASSVLMVPTLAANLGFYLEPFSGWLERFSQLIVPGETIYVVAQLALVVGFGVAFSQLFYRPDLVAATTGGGEEAHRSLVWQRTVTSVGYLAGLVLGAHMVNRLIGVTVNLILGVYVTAAALDIKAEWRARQASKAPLVKIWELHRIYAVEPVRRALEGEGITACFRGLNFRSLLYFFGPYVPVDVMVPAPRAEQAYELVLQLLIPEEEDEDEVIEAAVPK